MSLTSEEIRQKAKEALDQFYPTADGDYLLKVEVPDWVIRLVLVAHKNMPPDPYRRQFIYAALKHIATDGYTGPPAYLTTGEMLEWAQSSLSRIGYCDKVLDCDYEAKGIYLPKTLWGLLVRARELEQEEVLQIVKAYLESL